MENLIAKLYQSPKTVLTIKDLALIWEENNVNNLKAKTSYYTKRGILKRLSRGIFTKDKKYNPKELATSFYTPSYISFETVLRESGVIFQHYDTIFAASHLSAKKQCDGYRFLYRKLKDEILFSPLGIQHENGFDMAARERAFLDMLYLFPSYYFDNLHSLDWEKCFDWVGLYKNQQLIKRLNTYHKNHAE